MDDAPDRAELLRDLLARDLSGVDLVISDAHPGLTETVEAVLVEGDARPIREGGAVRVGLDGKVHAKARGGHLEVVELSLEVEYNPAKSKWSVDLGMAWKDA